MGRSLKKGPFIEPKLLLRVEAQDKAGDRAPLKTWSRRCTIPPEFVNHTFLVHNGKTFVKVYVVEDMVGHKLGEFAPTRIFRGHGGRASKLDAGKSPAGAAPAAAAPSASGKK